MSNVDAFSRKCITAFASRMEGQDMVYPVNEDRHTSQYADFQVLLVLSLIRMSICGHLH